MKQDFAQRQYNIITFVRLYTRQATAEENSHYLYCNKTGVKLLPSVLHKLAVFWVQDPDNYLTNLNLLLKEVGRKSDDGNYWVDKYTGYPIIQIDNDVDYQGAGTGTGGGGGGGTGADDAGATVIAMNTIVSKDKEKEMADKFVTPESKKMLNIVNIVSNSMEIDLNSQKEFIIHNARKKFLEDIMSEKDYEEKVNEFSKRNKKLPDYEDYYNRTMLLYTLSLILIGIQTQIPSVRSRRTYPGCVKSFYGFPLDRLSEDISGILYLSCVVSGIKSSTKTSKKTKKTASTSNIWSSLSGYGLKTSEDIANNLKKVIEIFLTIPKIDKKLREKLEYLALNKSEQDYYSNDHELSKWTQFLPAIVPFKMKSVINISADFKERCLSKLKTGSKSQCEDILVIQSKIIYYSFALQQAIQEIVNKETLMFVTSTNDYLIENACCNDNMKTNVISYFNKKNPSILSFNEIVVNLANIIYDIGGISKAPVLTCQVNSKYDYPPWVDNVFNEETIYLAFIKYCKFTSILPLSEELKSVCGDNKPSGDIYVFKNLSLGEKIKKLKEEGKIYNDKSMITLLQHIGKIHILHTQTQQSQSQSQKADANAVANKKSDKILPEEFVTLIKPNKAGNIEDDDDVLDYVKMEIKNLKTTIINFVTKNVSNDKKRTKTKEFASFFTIFSKRSLQNEEFSNYIQFLKQYIVNFCKIFPCMIMNSADKTNLSIPKYWDLSQNHEENIKNFIKSYYLNLESFYGNETLNHVLFKIVASSETLLKLANNNNSMVLFEYYFLLIFNEYKNLSEMRGQKEYKKPKFDDTGDLSVVEEDVDNDDDDDDDSGEDEFEIDGNMRKTVSDLLMTYVEIMMRHNEDINLSYDTIMDYVFKIKEREKDKITDRLKALTDDDRITDTIMKKHKLGLWGKGLQKGLTQYVKEDYNDEILTMEENARYEKKLIRQQKRQGDNAGDMDDFMEEERLGEEIDREEYDLSEHLGENDDDYDMNDDYEGDNWDNSED